PPITGFAEVVLNVDDLPAMRAFYRDVLGFPVHSEASLETETPDPHGEPTIAFLTVGSLETPRGRSGHPQLLALIDYRRHIFARGRFQDRAIARSSLNHLAFEIPPETFEERLAHLESLELNPVQTEFPAMHARAIFFRDPEGNSVELIAGVSPPSAA
ncbi:MAG: VOC family protein, partial [Planctomycetota bacterium]